MKSKAGAVVSTAVAVSVAGLPFTSVARPEERRAGAEARSRRPPYPSAATVTATGLPAGSRISTV
ncbi:hypothetical protein WAJ72_20315, partial [Acinetobacter baumannii]